MRKIVPQLFRIIYLLHLLLIVVNVNAQTATNFQNTILNVVQTSDRTLEFDIYLLNTDIGQTMELASYQAGITLNPAIYAGGNLTASIVAGSSSLVVAQIPSSITYTASATIIKLAAKAPPGSGGGSIISQVSPGTRIIKLKLTSTVPFISNTTPDFFFEPDIAESPSYATAVALYISGVNTQLPVAMGVNAFVAENPRLNPPVAVFSVTGEGSYCEGSGGLPVGLSGSENGVTYTLYKDITTEVTSVDGTGSAINFGNQLSGTYTVNGTGIGGNTLMSGEAVINEVPAPAAPVISTVTQPTCDLETGSVILTGLPSGNWTISPGDITGSTSSTTIKYLSASSYSFTVTASGCSSAPSQIVVINAQPETPPKPIITLTGNYLESNSPFGNQWYNASGIINGATEQRYTPQSDGNYYVVVTNDDGCISDNSDIISFITDIERIRGIEGISIYPNPAVDYLTIENNSQLSSIEFEIMNSKGEKIYNEILSDIIIIEISRFSHGVYFIRFTKGDTFQVYKFIKK